jgi:methionine biosynthesis protein MetW
MPDDALTEHYEQRAATYAQFGNGALAALAQSVLPEGGSVLDVGCASGGLLALLAPRAGRTAGIELSQTAARAASAVADEVHHGGIADRDLPFAPGSFDVVVLADVLEHLPDPEAGLRRAVDLARPGGALVISVPNIAHWQARLTLLRGRWPAEESGTFDAGHLRFFTLESVGELLIGAGLSQVQTGAIVPRLGNHVALPVLEAPAERVWQRLGRRLPRLLGYQVIALGRRPR